MPEYQDDVLEMRQAKKEKYDDLINSGGLSASVGWPISLLRAELIIHLALADLGVHHIFKEVCNCGLVVTRYPKTGHRDHKTKEPITRSFHLSSKVGNEYW